MNARTLTCSIPNCEEPSSVLRQLQQGVCGLCSTHATMPQAEVDELHAVLAALHEGTP